MSKTEKSSAATIAQTQTHTTDLAAKQKEIKLLQQKIALQKGIPFLYAYRLYPWQKRFLTFDPSIRVRLIVAGNQIGKSFINIKLMFELASRPELWAEWFPKGRPFQFWFLMPTRDLISKEFHTKWKKKYLPQNGYENHPQFGWKAEFKQGDLKAIHFNTGVSIYMHTYEQDVHHLQAGTVDALFVDEEVPEELMGELLMRIFETDGLLCASMTPTRGQEYWRKAFEEIGTPDENFKGALKLKVSVYDCLKYDDGTPSTWTIERINRKINQLSNPAEIDLRIEGKFVGQSGLVLDSFRRERNIQEANGVPNDWYWYSGVDLGGGEGGSLPAIVFIAVRPDFKKGRVVKSWVGEKEKPYENSDVYTKYLEMRGDIPMMGEYYDFASKDFGLISQRTGGNFQPANKSRTEGFGLLNTLYKNQMLDIDKTDENEGLVREILGYRHGQNKKRANDHRIDAKRYCAIAIPWDFTGISGEKIILPPAPPEPYGNQRRRTDGNILISDPFDKAAMWSEDAELELMADTLNFDYD